MVSEEAYGEGGGSCEGEDRGVRMMSTEEESEAVGDTESRVRVWSPILNREFSGG